MTSIKSGPLKDRNNDMMAFLEERIGVKPNLDGDTIKLEGSEKSLSSSKVKTYLKRFLYNEGLRSHYRILCEKGVIKIIDIGIEEES